MKHENPVSNDLIDHFVAVLIRNKVTFLSIILIITIFFLIGMTRLHVNNDTSKALPDDLVEVVNVEKIRQTFNAPFSVIYMVRFDDESLQEKITLLNEWASQFEEITVDGERGVFGVAHLGKLKVPIKGGMLGIKAGEISPQVSSKELISRINNNRELTGSFISDDYSIAVMIIFTAVDVERHRVLAGIQDVLAGIQHSGYSDSYITGATATSWYLNKGMRENFRVLLPIAISICTLILLGIFRRFSFVFTPLLIIVIALIWIFGLMGYLGIDFTLLSSVIPLILFPIGLANSIHVLKSYNHYRVSGESFIDSFSIAYNELMRAILLTSLTTFFGFASFLFSELKWTQSFGVFTGIAVMITLFLTVILLPLLISQTPGKKQSDQSERLIPVNLFRWAVFDSPAVKILLGITLMFALYFAPRIEFDNNPINFFNLDHDIVISDSIVSDQFGGTRFFDVVIESDSPVVDSADWANIYEITHWLREQKSVGRVVSLVPVLKRSSQIVKKRELSETAVTLVFKSFASKMSGVMRSFISDDKKKIKLSLTLKNIEGENYLDLAEVIKGRIESKYPIYNVTCGGQALMLDAGMDLLVKTQLVSLSITFVMVTLILVILFRSVKLGIYTTIPIVLSSLTVAGSMALFGVAINTVTVIIINTSVGIGIDYAIHFTAGYLRARGLSKTNREAIINAVKRKGAVILFNTIAVGVGLLVLLFSNFPPIRELGLFIFLSMAVSSLFSLTFLPLFLQHLEKQNIME